MTNDEIKNTLHEAQAFLCSCQLVVERDEFVVYSFRSFAPSARRIIGNVARVAHACAITTRSKRRKRLYKQIAKRLQYIKRGAINEAALWSLHHAVQLIMLLRSRARDCFVLQNKIKVWAKYE